jgi:outer membrane protein OmpU
MNKFLLGTTALVAASTLFGGGAFAQAKKAEPIKLEIGGYFQAFYEYVDQDESPGPPAAPSGNQLGPRRSHDIFREAELHFKGSTTFDNGLQVGIKYEIEMIDCSDQVDDSFVWFESGYGRLEIGGTDGVGLKMFYGAPTPIIGHGMNTPNIRAVNAPIIAGVGGNLISSPSTYIDTFEVEKINYFTPRISGIQLGVSYSPAGCEEGNRSLITVSVNGEPPRCGGVFRGMLSNDTVAGLARQEDLFEIAGNYVRSFAGIDLSLYAGYVKGQTTASGAGLAANADNKQFGTGGSVTYSNITLGGGYKKNTDILGIRGQDQKDWNIGLSYAMGALTLGAQYHNTEADLRNLAVGPNQSDEFNGTSVGAIYEIGPGVKITGGIQYFDWSSSLVGTPNGRNEAWNLVFGTAVEF